QRRADLAQKLLLERTPDAGDEVGEVARVAGDDRRAAGVQRREVEALGVRAADLLLGEEHARVRDRRLLLRLPAGDVRRLLVADALGGGDGVVEGLVRRRVVRIAAGRRARVARRAVDALLALDLAVGHRGRAAEIRLHYALREARALRRDPSLALGLVH